ncbi:MAG: sulfotransferase family 2 domain-containing protein [Pseudomonadota bacterium]
MPLISAPQHRIFFAHVPKCGGSSVEDYLIRRFGGPLSTRDVTHFAKKRRRGLLSSATHPTAGDLTTSLLRDLSCSFAMVRDSIERALSQYRFQTGVSRTSKLSFSIWRRLMRCVAIDPRIYQNHIRPQSELVPGGAEFFKLEDGFTDMIARLDAVTQTKSLEGVGHPLNRKSVRADVTPSRSDIELLEDYYAEDFKRFGYPRRDLTDYQGDPYVPLRSSIAHLLAPVVVWKQRRHWIR